MYLDGTDIEIYVAVFYSSRGSSIIWMGCLLSVESCSVILSRRNLRLHPWHFMAYYQAPGHQPSGSDFGLTKPPLSHEPVLICASPSASVEREGRFFLSQCWEVHRTNTLSCQRLALSLSFPFSLLPDPDPSIIPAPFQIKKHRHGWQWGGGTPSLWRRRVKCVTEKPWSSFIS